jgi:hypothetical protein
MVHRGHRHCDDALFRACSADEARGVREARIRHAAGGGELRVAQAAPGRGERLARGEGVRGLGNGGDAPLALGVREEDVQGAAWDAALRLQLKQVVL